MHLIFQLELLAYPSMSVRMNDLVYLLSKHALASHLAETRQVQLGDSKTVNSVRSYAEVISFLAGAKLGLFQLIDNKDVLLAEVVKYAVGFGLWVYVPFQSDDTFPFVYYRQFASIFPQVASELGHRYEFRTDTGLVISGYEFSQAVSNETITVLDEYGWYQLVDTFWSERVPWRSDELVGADEHLLHKMNSLPHGVRYEISDRLLLVDWLVEVQEKFSFQQALQQRAEWLIVEMSGEDN